MARTLSETASVVLKVSVDGDITIFRSGEAVTTPPGHPARVHARSARLNKEREPARP